MLFEAGREGNKEWECLYVFHSINETGHNREFPCQQLQLNLVGPGPL